MAPVMRFAWLWLASSACSWALVQAPPTTGATPAHHCTESRTAPIIDTVLAAGGIGGGIGMIVWDQNRSCPGGVDQCGSRGVVSVLAVPPMILGLIFAISARSGWIDTGACSELHASRPSP